MALRKSRQVAYVYNCRGPEVRIGQKKAISESARASDDVVEIRKTEQKNAEDKIKLLKNAYGSYQELHEYLFSLYF